MKMSETITALSAALHAAQSEIENVEKAGVNTFFKKPDGSASRYATLEDVIAALKPALNAHGLSFMQVYEPSEAGQMAMTTLLLHTSGEWISGTATVPLPKNDPQGYGSASTYCRRYSLMALVGLSAEDDDGNAAQAPARPSNVHATDGAGAGGREEKAIQGFRNAFRRRAEALGLSVAQLKYALHPEWEAMPDKKFDILSPAEWRQLTNEATRYKPPTQAKEEVGNNGR